VKLLHTSDWHVGRTLRGISRADEHREVLAEISGLAAAHAVDLVLVTGDLFDTAAPSPEAEEIVYRALLDLEATGARVVVLSGNHDSDRRLGAVAPLLQRGGVTVSSSFRRPDAGGIVEVACADGSTAQVACLPFISQKAALLSDDLMSSSAKALGAGYVDVMRDLIDQLVAGFTKGAVTIMAAHLFAEKGEAGGSERSAHIADGYLVPTGLFPSSLHYVALGHLHRPQSVGQPSIRYAGSPLQLDFGEAGEAKSVVLVDVTPTTPAKATLLPLASGRHLRQLVGTLDDLTRLAGTTADDHLKVVVRDQARVGLADQIRDLFPLCVDVLVAPPAGTEREKREKAERSGRSPAQLFASYLEEQHARDERVQALFDRLVDEAAVAEPFSAA
jgi:exonuclease SbcD